MDANGILEFDLVDGTNAVKKIRFQLNDDFKNFTITVFNSEEVDCCDTYNGYDYFDAFSKLRIDVEKNNFLIACVGCLKNVFTSRMSASMSRGLSAYKYDPVEHEFNLVSIFDDLPEPQYGDLVRYEVQQSNRMALIRDKSLRATRGRIKINKGRGV